MCMWNFVAEQIFIHKMTAFFTLLAILEHFHLVNDS